MKSAVAGAGVAFSGLAAFGSDVEGSASRIGNLDHLSPAERNRRLAELLTKDAFSKQLNTSFQLSSQSSTTILDLKLTEVQEGRSNEQFEQFSILFTGPQEPILNQSMYRLEHPDMGSFDLFLVPIQSDEGGTVYEAVFSYNRQ